MVAPSAKQQRANEEKKAAEKAAKKAAHEAAPKAKDGKCAVEWACKECGGTHYWGHGDGKDPKLMKGEHKEYVDVEPRIWTCGVSSCRKVLPKLDEKGQSAAKQWASLVAAYGMEAAKAIDAGNDEDLK